ncbi:hypothetical protein PYJP_06100 [Pyrofollis japonicus]|uniref:hypothetical protein n=1 Tax=Pyrofollis japonicus TaxID=3060460 RepID=UPI00295B4821|nr:hypothetical protein [Pyrofollis japonicus]BEP17258.1 hypothetical protein PYJP_06100 [Pyrofollis japonicus]
MTGKRRRRCKYYVNTNFIVDLMRSNAAAVGFAKRRRGVMCSSSLVVAEFREIGRSSAARRAMAEHGVRLVKLRRPTLRRLAKRVILEHPGLSVNSFLDYLHVYAARLMGVEYFVTSDRAACNRAIRAGLCCINYRSGEERCPSSR